MSGVWFVCSIPTASFERKLKHPEEWKEKKGKNENSYGRAQLSSNQENRNGRSNQENNRPNGQVHVDIHNEENLRNNRGDGQDSPQIIPPTPKQERKEKKGDDDEKSLEWHLKDCLDKLDIYDAVWILSLTNLS
ncbi:hypothetical protein JTE90_011675 [Oedothorax gibbosus]|uniref:Uncharacterized protein n=1 Tax=Oedothorax gibbosus TaxID=931172 RepID=A0AAV6USW8_9ARAC|nr:hypothetical protein JTE90_011675 [Oedothorax gibbosus]KAG8187305.1 hypothetical protein JTE90_011675 [Oedothorax gibbosus]